MTDVTLADFLLARIAGEEAEAHRLAEPQEVVIPCHTWVELAHTTGGSVAVYLPRANSSTLLKVRRADTTRVLADCEARRRIVELHRDSEDRWDDEADEWVTDNRCRTMRLLALPYADHPDYDESWRP